MSEGPVVHRQLDDAHLMSSAFSYVGLNGVKMGGRIFSLPFFFFAPFFFSVPLVPWSSGPVVLWSRGPLVPWSLGLLGPLNV